MAGGASVPLIDIAPLVAGSNDTAAAARVGAAIDEACRSVGFFSIVGHGVDAGLRAELDRAAREFFALPDGEKAAIAMERGGRAWRGWFPLGGELTSGRPDHKEGIYFGAELPADDPRVAVGTPLHGPNLFPARPAALRDAVLVYIDALTVLGAVVMRGVAVGLGLDPQWFERTLTAEPTVLFRIFHYPPTPTAADNDWGVAEHTDYGLLTLLMQDATGGLQVRATNGWTDVDADPDAFVCNIGDMLERMTAGRYRSTPHRVRNTSRHHRLSFPFFYDPGWDARVVPVPGTGTPPIDAASDRWDRDNPHAFSGTYGEYLISKVSKVFPELRADVL
jgi:isopenicillin N synthase-like dioxygenase